MNFFLDHDVPADIGRVLRLKGHGVEFLRDVLPKETPDVDAMRYASRNQQVMVTCNRDDFLDLARTEPHSGIIVLIRRGTRVAECAAVLRLLDNAGESGITNNINYA